ncbi:MAG: MEDS domain-containing protein, partial [Thermodesulfobacteriota bacterium]
MGFSQERFKEGHHIIYIYNDDHERKKTLSKFINQGLIENERILYLVDGISPEEMKKELMIMGVNTEKAQEEIDITKGHHSFCQDNCFSSHFMLGVVADYYNEAIKQGYAGARGAGEMSWALQEGRATVPDLLHYEASLNDILKDHPLTTVCQHDARR